MSQLVLCLYMKLNEEVKKVPLLSQILGQFLEIKKIFVISKILTTSFQITRKANI